MVISHNNLAFAYNAYTLNKRALMGQFYYKDFASRKIDSNIKRHFQVQNRFLSSYCMKSDYYLSHQIRLESCLGDLQATERNKMRLELNR